MRGISGTESLVVCLSEYLPLCTSNDSHDSSVEVCFLKRSLHRNGNPPLRSFVFPHWEGKMGKFWKCRVNLEKIRMDYSCHGRYRGIHVVF